MFVPFIDPITNKDLYLDNNAYKDKESNTIWPVIRSIPRFCDFENYSDNYTENFGYQWNIFSKNQIDSYSNIKQSEERFYLETDWKYDELENQKILEVGSGAGRFTEVFLRTTNGTLHSFDFSNAVEANLKNNYKYIKRLCLFQASLYQIPFPDKSFDKVFCLGVLQHTPSYKKTLSSITKKLNISGEIVVDFYPIKSFLTFIHSKYFFRLFTPLIPKKTLLQIIQFSVPGMILLFDLFCFCGLSILTRFIPITDLRLIPKELSKEERKSWAIMDTFDAFSPKYDNPKSIKQVSNYLQSIGFRITFAGYVHFTEGYSAVVRAIREK